MNLINKISKNILICIFIALGACNFELEKKYGQKEFQIYDSINIQIDSLLIYALDFTLWNEHKHFLILTSKNQVYLINAKGETVSRIGDSGDAPGQYKTVVGLTAHSLDSIFIADIRGDLYLYDRQGNYLKDYKYSLNDTLNSPYIYPRYIDVNYLANDTIQVEYHGLSTSQSVYDVPEYFKKAKCLSISKTGNQYAQNFIPYEDESIYHKGKLPGQVGAAIGKLPISKNYVVIYPNEDLVYIYDKKSKNLVKKIHGESKLFPKTTKLFSFEQRITTQDAMEHSRVNAENYLGSSVISFAEGQTEFCIKQYTAPYLGESNNNPSEYLLKLSENAKKYAQIYDLKSGSKLFNDILLPGYISTVAHVKSFEEWILVGNTAKREDNILYLARITEDSNK
jgi:hypothetical protein